MQPATGAAPANLFGAAAPSAIADTKEDLEKALVGTSWTWEDDNGRLAFASGGKAETDGHPHKWQATGRRSLTVDGIGFTFDESLSTYKCPGWPNGARSGKRIK